MTIELLSHLQELEASIAEVVIGKPDVIRCCIVALLAGEHILLEDVPGVGKTLVGKALAQSLAADFSRIQFTPDLLPSDIVGSSVFDAQTSEFRFNRGPIFTNILLADEINRTPPRTQAALLEAMSEGQATVDGTSYDLPKPFLVIATQNPFEFEGTYPLPESQLDRFLLRVSVGYPDREEEARILRDHREGEPVEQVKPVINRRQILSLQSAVREVAVDESISDYLLDIVGATRSCDELHVGVSTRGTLSWYRGAQALALISGRDYVVPDDVKSLAVPVLAHRVVPKAYLHGGQRHGLEALIRRIVEDVVVPD